MDDAKFDRLARALARFASRRWFLAVCSAMFGMLGQRVARGFQLGPATCGEQGAVCTLISGCCDGLTCATSAINTSYGICVPGDGGMVSTGTTLISPFGETAVEEVTALLEAAPTAPATDPQAERQARLAELRARKDARRTREKTRLDTQRTTVRARKDARHTKIQTRKAERRNRQLQAREAAEAALGPTLEFELFHPGGTTGTETLRITNRDDASIFLVKIESLLHPQDNNATNRTVPSGGSFSYYSGTSQNISDEDEQAWISLPICSGSAGAGFRVTVGVTANSVNQQHVILCDGPSLIRVNEPPASSARRRGKRDNQGQKKKKKR
jgi:hypothetical protein